MMVSSLSICHLEPKTRWDQTLKHVASESRHVAGDTLCYRSMLPSAFLVDEPGAIRMLPHPVCTYPVPAACLKAASPLRSGSTGLAGATCYRLFMVSDRTQQNPWVIYLRGVNTLSRPYALVPRRKFSCPSGPGGG